MCIWYNSGQLFFYVKSGESQRCEPFRCRNVYSHVFAQVRKMSISDIQEHSQNHGIIFDDIYVLNPSRISDLRLMQWSIQGLLWRIRSNSPPKNLRRPEGVQKYEWNVSGAQTTADTSWDHFVLLDLPMNSWTSGKDDFSHSMCFPFADQCLDSWSGVQFFSIPQSNYPFIDGISPHFSEVSCIGPCDHVHSGSSESWQLLTTIHETDLHVPARSLGWNKAP